MLARLAAVFLVLAAPSLAQNYVGTNAPNLQFLRRLGLPEGFTSLADLRGGAVLLAYVAVNDDTTKEFVQWLGKLHDKFAARNLIVLASTTANADDVQKWVEAQKPKFPFVVEGPTVSLEDLGLHFVPQLFLIDPAGKVVWDGRTMGLKDEIIDKVLEKAQPVLAPLDGPLQPVQVLIDQQKPGKAMALVQQLQREGKLPPTHLPMSDLVLQRLQRQGATMLARAREHRQLKKTVEAAIVLHQVCLRFEGGPPAQEAMLTLRDLGKDPTGKKEVDGALLLAKARLLEADKKFDDAYAQYKSALAFTKTEVEAKAQEGMARIDAQGVRGFRADCADCTKANRACKKHLKK